ncbi:MAG: hypothetical protein M3511_09280 [Deinococcota bacterium]|nr:hypothetical protein [Deinococcota bacterium]
MQDKYEWFWLYSAAEPATGESFSLYLPRLVGVCLKVFLEQLSAAYPDDDVLSLSVRMLVAGHPL